MNEVRMNLLHDKSCTSKEVSQRFILFQMKLKQSLKINKTSEEKGNSFWTKRNGPDIFAQTKLITGGISTIEKSRVLI